MWIVYGSNILSTYGPGPDEPGSVTPTVLVYLLPRLKPFCSRAPTRIIDTPYFTAKHQAVQDGTESCERIPSARPLVQPLGREDVAHMRGPERRGCHQVSPNALCNLPPRLHRTSSGRTTYFPGPLRCELGLDYSRPIQRLERCIEKGKSPCAL